MERLQELQRISKVCIELENHIGTYEIVLAEFLIELAESSGTFDDFKYAVKKASGNGPSLPHALTKSIYRVVRSGKRFDEKVVKVEGNEKRGENGVRGSGNRGLNDGDRRGNDEKREGYGGRVDPVKTNGGGDGVNGFQKNGEALEGGFLGSGINREEILARTEKEFAEHERELEKRRDEEDYERSRRYERPTRNSEHARRVIEHHLGPPRGLRHLPDTDSKEVKEGAIYRGRIKNIKEFGAFVIFGSHEGLVHISKLGAKRRVENPQEVVSRGQNVFVKVLSVSDAPRRISLSMNDIDQQTGRDLSKNDDPRQDRGESRRQSRGEGRFGANRGLNGMSSSFNGQQGEDHGGSGRAGKKIPETEQWELTQLANAGILSLDELRKQSGVNPVEEDEDAALGGHWDNVEDPVEETEVELNEHEPAFLLRVDGISHEGPVRAQPLSPVRIVKNPDGSMQRAAMTQSALAKERREMRDKERQAKENELPTDLNRAWEDPMSSVKDRRVAAELRGLASTTVEVPEWKKEALGAAPRFGLNKKSDVPLADQRKSLPIYKLREELLEAFANHQILIVVGETGSGKSTQMTQYLAEAGYTTRGRIGCTQPRRVAAISVAKRVAEERGTRLGEEVGYAIRFEDVTSPQTQIKYMTDGILLREALLDTDLRSYSVIMLDEAHERTIHTDVLFGLLKQCAQRRKDLKVIVTSATLDAEKFSSYFLNCPIFTIPGRTFPVEKKYLKAPVSDYLDNALMTVLQIHLTEPAGDVLLFLTGQEEIDTAAGILFSRMQSVGPEAPNMIILPVYAALPSEMQTRVFEPAPPGSRKVVIATNIAEASLTIDGIRYVVDPGFAKQTVYNPKLGMNALITAPISQASARQRAGRAGRTAPGICYRLYTEDAYKNEMLPSSIPELQRSNLANIVLTLKALGINDLIHFDFMDPPPRPHLIAAMESLYSLGALDEEGLLTRLGRTMAEFPLEPMQGKMLLASVELGCSDEVLTIVSMLSAQTVFYRPREKQAAADQKISRFHQPEGDHLTLLAVYQAWEKARFSSAWCYENFVQHRSLQHAQDIRRQLITIMDRYHLGVVSCGRNWVKIRKAIVSGFFVQAAKRDPQEGYRTLVEGQTVYIHPSSSLLHVSPSWVIYHQVILTTKEYMHQVLAIESKWLVELAPRFFKVAEQGKLGRRKRREKIEPLFDKYAQNQNEWRLSKRRKH